MIFKKHLSKTQAITDLFNYAYFVDDGVIINKDGAFVISFKFRGFDINSASGAEMDALTANFNRMGTFLEDGWMIHVDELRVPSMVYPEKGSFSDEVSELIDEERRQLYESEGAHFENFQFLTFIWKFPLSVVKTSRHWFVDGLSKENGSENLTTLLKHFNEVVDRCVGIISINCLLERLNSSDLLSFLNTCITGDIVPVAMPPTGFFIDGALGRKPFLHGYVPVIGNKKVYVLSIIGYLNRESIPGILEELGTYPLIYRWSNRFIPLSKHTAEREIKRYQKNWNNKVKGLVGIVKEVITGRESLKVNNDALEMVHETQDALTLNSNGSTRFGYWTSEIVLIDENVELLNEAVKHLGRYLEQLGFTCQLEGMNSTDAWLGTIPAHGSSNARRMFVNTMYLAQVLPLQTIWTGKGFSAPSSLLPAKSPPVFYAATTGNTPYRYHTDVEDVGNQIVIGPTGAGKSTFIGFLATQFFRYLNSEVYIFDKDYSHKATTIALEGNHYDIGNEKELSFCPLADLSTESKKGRASLYIEELVHLQNVVITPAIRSEIYTAIQSLANDTNLKSRNLTIFQAVVQNADVRAAIKYYTIEGQLKTLDGNQDSMQFGRLQTFEMNWLLNQKPEIYLPVLKHIFNQIESRLEESNGKNPTLIILEEAWLYISHPVFAKMLKDWLKTLRKRNARVVFVTQSMADLYDPITKTLTATTAAIIESCPTKVFLPNLSMDSEIKQLYKMMGLSERQIEIISRIGIPKKNYYVVSPEGNRLIDLGFDRNKSIALSFVGLSKDRSEKLIACKNKYGKEWVYHWLIQNDHTNWADYYKNKFIRSDVA